MQRIFPKKLKPNDTIGLVSVAGAIENPIQVKSAINYFSKLGFNVKVSNNIEKQNRYLSGSDEERANALNSFFADDQINAIIALRGGYGSIRILDKIHYEVIKQNPKIFGGYSDITALSLMIFQKTGLVTFNTPMPYSDFVQNKTGFSQISFIKTLQNGENTIKLIDSKTYNEKIANGVLWGGNLSTIQSLCGTDFIPDEKFILVAEDINEPVYKLDKMFTQLFNIEKFKQNITGLVLGDFSNIDNNNYFDELIKEISQKHKIAAISGLKFGHEEYNTTFPIGVKAQLNTKTKSLDFCEEFLQ